MSLLDTASLIVTPNGYKAGTLYSVIPNTTLGDLSVTRATTATRVNSSGLIESVASNVPRLDYSNGSCPSILVEPQRTNLFNYSEQFDNAFWTKSSATVTANNTISPDGTANADKVEFNSGFINSTVIVTDNQTYTISFFAKKGTANLFQISEAFYVGTTVAFDLNTGIVTSGTGKIENYGNGWYRCSMQFTYGVGQSVSSWVIRNYQSGYIYLWGAQLEAGSYATSYIPTTSASVTRNADVISKTGISSLIGQTEGTLFVDFYFKQGIESFIIGSGNGSYFNNLAIECYSNKAYITIFNNSASLQGTIETTTLTTGKHRLAVAYNSTQVIAYLDGVSVGTLGAVTFPSFNNLYLGNLGSDTNPKNTNINTASICKTRLTNTQLAQLTTI